MPFTPFGRGDKFFSQNAITADQIRGGTITSQQIVLGGANAILRSQNFVSGTSGWQIDGVGNAEFNDVTIRGEIVGPTSGDYVMYFGPNGWRIQQTGGGIPFLGGPDSSGNFVMNGDGTSNGFYAFNFTSGLYIGPSDNAVPQTSGIVIEHNGTPSSSDTSILVRGDKFGTPVVLFQMDGDGVVKFSSGSAASPSITFLNDTDTGIIRTATNQIGFVAGASTRVTVGTGTMSPATDNTMGLGASGLRWVDVWAVDTTINSSDPRLKDDLDRLPIDSLDFVRRVQAIQFRWKDRSRLHFGFNAESVKDEMDRIGVDWGAFIDPADGSPLGLRQGELVPVLWDAVAQLAEKVNRLEERIAKCRCTD